MTKIKAFELSLHIPCAHTCWVLTCIAKLSLCQAMIFFKLLSAFSCDAVPYIIIMSLISICSNYTQVFGKFQNTQYSLYTAQLTHAPKIIFWPLYRGTLHYDNSGFMKGKHQYPVLQLDIPIARGSFSFLLSLLPTLHTKHFST